MCAITGTVQPSPSTSAASFSDIFLTYSSGTPCNLALSSFHKYLASSKSCPL